MRRAVHVPGDPPVPVIVLPLTVAAYLVAPTET